MNAKKFLDFLRAVGLGDDEAWAGVLEGDQELNNVVDKAVQEVGGWAANPRSEKRVHQTLRLVIQWVIAQ